MPPRSSGIVCLATIFPTKIPTPSLTQSSRWLFRGVEFLWRPVELKPCPSRDFLAVQFSTRQRHGPRGEWICEEHRDSWGRHCALRVENCALAALANWDPSGHSNQPINYTLSSNPSERRGGAKLGPTVTSRAAQTLRSNHAKIPKRHPKDALTASSIYGCGKRHITISSWNQILKLVSWLWTA